MKIHQRCQRECKLTGSTQKRLDLETEYYCQYYQSTPIIIIIIIIIIIVCNTNTFLHSFLIRTERDLRIGENALEFERPVDPDSPTFPPPAGCWDSTRQ